jgi:hypothetical protein
MTDTPARSDAGTTQALELETCGWCKGPISRNPHPDAGKPATLLTVGAVWECIPCLNRSRQGWHERAMRAKAENARLREYYEASEAVEREWNEAGGIQPGTVSRLVAARRALANAGEVQ